MLCIQSLAGICSGIWSNLVGEHQTMLRKWYVLPLIVVVCTSSWSRATRAADVGNAFTYQGYLEKPAGTTVTGNCNFVFRLWDDPAGGVERGDSPQTVSGVSVVKGVFTVEPPDIDFGPGAFDGTGRWLAIDVQCAGDVAYVQLSPRVELAPAPYALRAVDGVGPPNAIEVDATTGNVGIGASSPASRLDILDDGPPGTARTILSLRTAESTDGTAAHLDFAQETTVTGRISNVTEGPGRVGLSLQTYNDFFPGNDPLRLAEAVRLSYNGYVGVGTPTPRSRLDILDDGPPGTARTILSLRTAESTDGTAAHLDFA